MSFNPSEISNKIEQLAIAAHARDLTTLAKLCNDDHPEVRARAIRTLGVFGSEADPLIRTAVGDSDARVRAAAASAASHHEAVDILDLLSDESPAVVECACFAMGEREDASTRTALEQIAKSHDDPLCRESAIAALGVIGAQESLTVILAALKDKAYVRRRAVVALSAFDGPEVDEALRQCLTDKDHQVRQLAEDLLEVDGPSPGSIKP